MKSYPDQRYTNEHIVSKILKLREILELKLKKSRTPEDIWAAKREYIVAQIIWMREGGLIKNDIYRDFRLL